MTNSSGSAWVLHEVEARPALGEVWGKQQVPGGGIALLLTSSPTPARVFSAGCRSLVKRCHVLVASKERNSELGVGLSL